MSNVINIFTRRPVEQPADDPVERPVNSSLLELLYNLTQMAMAGEILHLGVAAIIDDDSVLVGWNTDGFGTKQRLVSEMQTNITYGVVKANMDQLIEEV